MKQRLGLLTIFLIPLASLIIGIWTLGHYGINWDEPYHYRRGQAFLHFFLTGKKTYEGLSKYPPLTGDSDNPTFRDSQKNWEELKTDPNLSDPNFRRSFYQDDSWNGEYFIDLEKSYGHPPLNGILASVFNKIFYQKLGILGDLESYRLFIVIVVSMTAFSVAYLMWKEFGLIESLFSSLVFATYPLLIGEQHFNIKDPVETAFYTITILAAYIGIKRNKLFWLFIAFFFFGFALATKFNIVFSLIPLALWFFYYLHKNGKRLRNSQLFKNVGIIVLTTPFIVLGIFLASYPALWSNPVNGIREVINFYLRVGYPESQTPLNTYPFSWIIYTTAPAVLLLLLTSFALFKKLIKKNDFVLLLFLWAITAIARNSLFGALSYGGVRLIMEFIPAFAMLAGVSAGYLANAGKNKKHRLLILSALALIFVPTISKLIQIHPNENVYFNFLIGGLSGAKEKNIPSWGDSYGNAYFQGVLWLNENAEEGAKVSVPVALTSNVPRFKLRPDLAVSPAYWSGPEQKGEYLIELTYNYPPKDWFALRFLEEAVKPVYEVKVDNIAIAKVWKNDKEHLRQEYKNTKVLAAKIKVDTKAKTLKVEIPNPEKIMKIEIAQPTENCKTLNTGFVTTSADGETWVREIEDAAVDQLNRHEIKEVSERYEFFFMARNAKVIIFGVDNEGACLLKARSALVTVLE